MWRNELGAEIALKTAAGAAEGGGFPSIAAFNSINQLTNIPSSFYLPPDASSGMLTRWLCKKHVAAGLHTASRRALSSSCRRYAAVSDGSPAAKEALDRTRNIGIIAHIDAVSALAFYVMLKEVWT